MSAQSSQLATALSFTSSCSARWKSFTDVSFTTSGGNRLYTATRPSAERLVEFRCVYSRGSLSCLPCRCLRSCSLVFAVRRCSAGQKKRLKYAGPFQGFLGSGSGPRTPRPRGRLTPWKLITRSKSSATTQEQLHLRPVAARSPRHTPPAGSNSARPKV